MENLLKTNPGAALCAAGRAARAGPYQHDALPRPVGSDSFCLGCGRTGIPTARAAVAAVHLLGVHPAVRLLPAAGTPPCGGVQWCLGAGRWSRPSPCCSCRRTGSSFGVLTLLGSGHDAHGCWTSRCGPDPAGGGHRGVGGAVCLTRQIMYGWVGFGSWLVFAAGSGCMPTTLRPFLALSPWLLFHRLFPADALALFVLGGFFLHHLVGKQRMEPLRRSVCPPLGWMGRHSLLLYLLHQPVIYGVLTGVPVL